MKKYLILLLLSVLTARAENKVISVETPPNDKTAKSGFLQGPLPEVDIAFSWVVLEKTRLSEILDKFGTTKVLITGDAASSNASICYLIRDKLAIRFNSDEMGGGKVVTKIEVFDKSYKTLEGCVKSGNPNIPSSTNSGVRLGLTRNEISRRFGKARSLEGPNIWNYMYSSEKPAPGCDEKWIVGESYKFEFKDERVIFFSISRSTSC